MLKYLVDVELQSILRIALELDAKVIKPSLNYVGGDGETSEVVKINTHLNEIRRLLHAYYKE